MYKVFLLFLLLGFINIVLAQSPVSTDSYERKGLTFGFSVGASVITLSHNDTNKTSITTTLPNIRIGYMVNKRLALQLLLPGSIYKYQGNHRGFEAILLSSQYWIKNKWWLLGGAGMTFDVPAFWTKNAKTTTDFNTGFPALALGTGFEIWHNRSFTLDLQYRIFTGRACSANGSIRQGISNSLILGLNWN